MPCSVMVRYQARLANKSSVAAANRSAAASGSASRVANGTASAERIPGIADPLMQCEVAGSPAADTRQEVRQGRDRRPVQMGGRRGHPDPGTGECQQRPPHMPALGDEVDRADAMLAQD